MNESLIIYLVWNLSVALFYGLDKSRAVRGERRIREKNLILSAFLMGGLGAILGMVVFNHKTSKPRFRILVPLAFAIQIFLVHFEFGGLL